jgi:hypothetical protein
MWLRWQNILATKSTCGEEIKVFRFFFGKGHFYKNAFG